MLVNNNNLTTIWYEQNLDKVKIIDQRLLPYELKIVELNTLAEDGYVIDRVIPKVSGITNNHFNMGGSSWNANDG